MSYNLSPVSFSRGKEKICIREGTDQVVWVMYYSVSYCYSKVPEAKYFIKK
jgi:hypothetical protein